MPVVALIFLVLCIFESLCNKGVQPEAWDRFASTIPHLAQDKGSHPTHVGHRCHRLYQSATLTRLGMGLPVRNDVPTRKCTKLINALEQAPAPGAGQIAFRLFHAGTGSIQGLRVLVEMTPAMKSVRRKPRENELTKAGVTESGSYFPLGENGETYLLDQPRYAIAPGQRYGLRVTIVTEEGLKTRALFKTELLGLAPTAQASAMVEAAVSDAIDTPSVTEITPDSSVSAQSAILVQDSPFIVPVWSQAPAGDPLHEEIQRRHRMMFDELRKRPIYTDAWLAGAARRAAELEEFMAKANRDREELLTRRAQALLDTRQARLDEIERIRADTLARHGT